MVWWRPRPEGRGRGGGTRRRGGGGRGKPGPRERGRRGRRGRRRPQLHGPCSVLSTPSGAKSSTAAAVVVCVGAGVRELESQACAGLRIMGVLAWACTNLLCTIQCVQPLVPAHFCAQPPPFLMFLNWPSFSVLNACTHA